MADVENVVATNSDKLISYGLELLLNNGNGHAGASLERSWLPSQPVSRMILVRSVNASLTPLTRFLARRPPGRLQAFAGLLYSLTVYHNRLLGIDSA